MNSSVEVYQGDQHGGLSHHIPMIPLGLKETKEVPFHDALHVRLRHLPRLCLMSITFSFFVLLIGQEFIEDHYKDKADDYVEAIAELSDLRQVYAMWITRATSENLFIGVIGFSCFLFFLLPVMILFRIRNSKGENYFKKKRAKTNNFKSLFSFFLLIIRP